MRAADAVLLLGLAAPLLASPAAAQTADASAKGHYEAGVRAYRDGRFGDAIDEFKAADAVKPSPALSFNIAQCFEKQADLRSARHYYVEYLQRKPDAEDRQAVQTTIASIDVRLAEEGKAAGVAPIIVTEPAPFAAPPPPAPAAATTAPAPSGHRHVASWILLGAGGVGLLTGGVLNYAAYETANGPTTTVQTGAQVQAAYNQANGIWTGALISYGVGAALGIAGFIVYFVENKG